MSYRLTLPPGTKVSEERVLRGFVANIKAGVEAGDPGSIAANQRAKGRLAELAGDRRALASRLVVRRLP